MKSKNYSEIEIEVESSIKTGNELVDNFWSRNGGLVYKTAIFLTGTSGAGKTTFAVNLQKVLNKYKTILYSREMSASSVKDQTKTLNINHKNAYICDNKSCPKFEDFLIELDEVKPTIIIVDSLQVIAKEDYPNNSEDETHFMIIQKLRRWIEDNNAILIMVGHNTKDGEFRGANTIMQMFDAHLEMVHHKKENIRTIAWGQKNRKGPLGMLYYEINDNGITFASKEEKTSDNKTMVQHTIDSIVEYVNALPDKKLRAKISKEVNQIDDTLSNIDMLKTFIDVVHKNLGLVN